MKLLSIMLIYLSIFIPCNSFKTLNNFELIEFTNKSKCSLQVDAVSRYGNPQLVKKLLGVWKYVNKDGQYVCRFYIESDKLMVIIGKYATDACVGGYITNIQYKNSNIVQITVFDPGYEYGPYGKIPPNTYYFDLDIKNINNKKMRISNANINWYFQKVTDDYNNWDKYFSYY